MPQPTTAAPRRSHIRVRTAIVAVTVLTLSFSFLAQSRAADASITGVAFNDADRDGVFDSSESVYSGHRLYLFSGGTYIGQSTTDAAGRYLFDGLPAGTYEVAYDASSWAPLKMDLVPTTTGSVIPSRTVDVSGPAFVDFGWRPITWSTDPDAPIATYTAPNGLRVQAYNDAVAPRDIADAVMTGAVGPEAARTTIRFALGSTSVTTTSVVSSGGVYQDFYATSVVSYEAWLMNGVQTLSHEYGHAWSWYHAYMTQSDPTMAAYVAARGLAGDPRVGSSYAWGAGEMIAEDYRQLLGPPDGRAASQANHEIPAAADVPGLHDFLVDVFTHPPAPPAPQPSPSPTPTPSPNPTPSTLSVDVTGLSVSPTIVKRSAIITFGLSLAAQITVTVLDGSGNIVKTLAAGLGEPAGAQTFTWDRTDANGKRVKAGAYTVKVRAEDPSGGWDTGFATFPVG